jgi:D-beta-D-heptose 7-phosphate kinase/D-beta-D-heptose 1-phosphate adenosyltransferase|tara:strand:- start:253 stop:1005 length:753 start_codon:yes stop_codon:yes gene_type:complete
MDKVLVIGDSCLDEYIYCIASRFCPDAPVPILKPESFISTLGMAGNVVDNLEALEIEVELISNANKIKKTRYVDSKTNHMFFRIDEGEDDVFPIAQKTLDNINWEDYNAVIISDYCKGFIDEDTIKYISKQHPITFLDTKKQIGSWVEDITFIKINDVEYRYSEKFIDNNYKDSLIITRGSNGAEYKGNTYPVKKVDVKDTSGAGDSFLAGLVGNYLETYNIVKSIKFANKCATQVVQKKGTAKINKNEI